MNERDVQHEQGAFVGVLMDMYWKQLWRKNVHRPQVQSQSVATGKGQYGTIVQSGG